MDEDADRPAKTPTPLAEITAFFEAQEKTVLTFLGFSGAGYQDPDRALEMAAETLDRFDPKTTLVNAGASEAGIGMVYRLAKGLGFSTSGIVSTRALFAPLPLSPAVDHVFYVRDEAWGGLLDDGERLSPTSEAMVAVSDVMVAIGGGEVARDELLAGQRLGKEVIYHAADMNHALAIARAERDGRPAPSDFRGAAAVFLREL